MSNTATQTSLQMNLTSSRMSAPCRGCCCVGNDWAIGVEDPEAEEEEEEGGWSGGAAEDGGGNRGRSRASLYFRTTASMMNGIRRKKRATTGTRAHLSAVAHPTLYPIASNLARTAASSGFGAPCSSSSSSTGLTAAASSEVDKRRAAICCWMALRWSR